MKTKTDQSIDRRTFLKGSSSTLIALTVAQGGMIIGAGNAWAATAKNVTPEAFATMVQACRDIYPHDHLADSFYAKVVEGFDAAAADSADEKALLENGVASLDKAAMSAHGTSYRDVGWEIDRTAILKAMESDPFFQKMRGALVTGIYNNPDAWPLFGYEGESASQGGYINRGFDDIDWLDNA